MSALIRQMLQDAPLGLWHMQDASGTAAQDVSGFARSGAYNNGAILNQPGPFGQRAVDYDGANDQMSAAMGTALDLAAVTAELWLNSDTNKAAVLVASRSVSVGTTVRFSCSLPSAANYMEAWNGAAVAQSAAGSLSLLNKWTHLVWAWGGGVVSMYANGVLLAAPTLAMGSATSQPFQVGGMTIGVDGYQFDGKIAYAAVYGSALSADRVLAHYQAGIRSGVVVG